MTEVGLTQHQALEEFHDILRQCCDRPSPPRYTVTRYQVCRMALLSGTLRAYLPGFITQCVSLVMFREFIHLYHPDQSARVRFVDRSLENCWTQLNEGPPPPADSFDLDDF